MKTITCFLFFVSCSFISGQEYSEIKIKFKEDTARIETLCRQMQDKDYSTSGIINALSELDKGYDKLLNKYYNILLNSIKKEEGRKKLIASQRNWIKFRDSEKELIPALIYDEEVEGSIWGVVRANAVVNITKTRVIEIINHLTLSDLGAK